MGTACSPIQLLLATFEPQTHGKCVIPVKCLYGVWCWFLWWCFLAGWLKKVQPNNNKKNPNHPHTSELVEVPCQASFASTGMLRSNPAPRQHKMTARLNQDTSWNVWHKLTQFLTAFNSRDKLDDSYNFHIPTFLLLLPSHCRYTASP